ncbi:50S ribosomal protein L33 [Candidatus Daviesbacteria bacterium]|nr:50S ribosomal protein L33 [Candidatus Daviesbacteria bacterium]
MKHRIFNISLFTLYITISTALMIWQGIGISPDRYAFVLLLGSLLVKKTRSFILDWLPFLFILISYDFLRSFADKLNTQVHYVELIGADKTIFGFIPTIELQKIFFHPGFLSWYDFLATILYFLHFALPLSFGFILWLKNKNQFKEFTTGILLLSYAGWLTYLAFPAAPPWLAGERGFLQGVTKIMDLTLKNFPERLNLPTIYHNFNPNPVAAMPSMHAAYPFLVFLFALKFFKLKALLFSPYVLAVWISIIYLGEHYAIDVVVGAFYAAVFYFVSANLHNWQLQKRLSFVYNLQTMAKKANRIDLGLECSVCKSRNYVTSKNTVNTKEKLSLKKFCRKCRKVQIHNEFTKLK